MNTTKPPAGLGDSNEGQDTEIGRPPDYVTILDKALTSLATQRVFNASALTHLGNQQQRLYQWIRDVLSQEQPLEPVDARQDWDWYSYIDALDLNIGILKIYQNKPIPIHDHPNATGILMVLSGKLAIDEYQIENTYRLGNMNLAQLNVTAQYCLGENDYTFITPDKGNLHGLAAASHVCYVLDIMLQPYAMQQRSWYLPASEQGADEDSFTAVRLNAGSFSSRGD